MKPRLPIRRFDVFAEYNRARNVEGGMPENLARGRAIWVAKVVAGRGRGSTPRAESGDATGSGQAPERDAGGFRHIGGEEQTDRTFDREIIDRMGADFYHQVFSPAITQAVREGKRYEDIRDTIRQDWK